MYGAFMTIFVILFGYSQGSTYIISQQFFTNSFTENDLTSWSLTGTIAPPMEFSSCGSQRIFGGYNIFYGDLANPTKISTTFPNLIPHYTVTISATVYKIDSWPNNTLFLQADGTTVALLTFNASNPGSSDICGNPSPTPDQVNTNFNQNIATINVTFAHFSTSLTVAFISNLEGNTGSWGIRSLNITMAACDQSCMSCTNSSNFYNYQAACISCDTANGLVLSGSYCLCSSALLKRQKTIPCYLSPCVQCVVPTCLAGYYPSSISTYCQPCNLACSVCTDPSNTVTSCSACSLGFVGNPLGGIICASCFSGCATCTSTAYNACLSCKHGYFYYVNSCLTACPSGFFGEQNAATCYPCAGPCLNCIGNTISAYFCLSCLTNYYLHDYTCSTSCPNNLYAYNGICYTTCPQATLANNVTFTCLPCINNCIECSTTSTCSLCTSNTFLLLGICYIFCPIKYYGDSPTQLCLPCDTTCLTCYGSTSFSCYSCTFPAILINSQCLTSCPTNTYSAQCLPCNPTCLTCIGPASNNCINCPSPQFYHLNFSTCITSCNKGQTPNNYDMTCSLCSPGQFSHYQVCTNCNPTCLTCNGISFLQCTTCFPSAQLIQTTCVLIDNTRVIYTPQMVSPSYIPILQTILIAYITTSIFVQMIFQYKTNLLPTIELFQILSYTYYLTITLSEQTQQTATLLYISNFAWLITPLEVVPSANLPLKFQLLGKTGYFFSDSMGIHFIMILSLVAFLILKYFSKRFIFIKKIYNKTNPYLITYFFRLISLQLFLDVLLYLYCFQLTSTMGVASFVLLIFDICTISVSTCWRIKTDSDGSQIALFFNNQIGQRKESQPEKYTETPNQDGIQTKIKKNLIFPSILILCAKIPIPISILLFIGNAKTQTICFLVYFVLYFSLITMLPFRRLIYKLTMIFGSIVLIINAGFGILVMNEMNSELFDVLWLIALLISFVLTILQIVFNYEYFFLFMQYIKHNLQEIVSGTVQNDQKNQESHGNLSQIQSHQPQPKILTKQDILVEVKQKTESGSNNEKEQPLKKDNVGKIKSNNLQTYLNLSRNTYTSENQIKLDLNL